MPVNQTLSTFSDLAFQTAFVIYLFALVLSLIYYVKIQGVINVHRARTHLTAEALIIVPGSDQDTHTSRSADTGVISEEEFTRKKTSTDKFGGMTQTLVYLGAIVHLVSVILRGLATDRFPLGNMYEYISMICVLAVISAALVVQRKEWRSIWPWLLLPILVLLFFAGTNLYSVSAPVVPALQSYWLPIHVTTVSLGAAIGILSGIASLLYLLRIWQPQGDEQGFFGAVSKPLPTAEKLDGLAYKSAIVTLPVLGLGIALGAIWAEAAWGRFWGWDPKETASFISWILYAAYLHARATAGWRNHKAAWINILALAMMIFNLFFINLVVSGLHSYAGLN